MHIRQPEMLPALRSLSVTLISFLCIVTDASAHGINFEISQRSPVVTVYAYFSRTSPVGDASVTIMAPGLDLPWQTGRTDKSGHFAFIPDQIGEWRIMVDDERGHRGRAMVTISRLFFNEDHHEAVNGDGSASEIAQIGLKEKHIEQDTTERITKTVTRTISKIDDVHHDHIEKNVMEKKLNNQIPILYRIVFGLSIIFGITGIWYGLTARKALRNEKKTH